MNYSILWPLLGLLLLTGVMVDFYITTMTLKGGGPMARRLTFWLWRFFLWLQKILPQTRALTAAGPIILLIMVIVWFALCWLGWFLFFCGDIMAVVNSTTQHPASLTERIYYAGFTLTTIGYGDFKTISDLYRVGSIISGFNGLFLVTLAITYSIPILSASAERRQLSLLIYSLGESTEQIINKGHDNGTFQFLAQQLQQLSEKIVSVSQNHLAYPVLHYFHDSTQINALPLNLVRLQESLLIVRLAFPGIPTSCKTQFDMTSQIINHFLHNIKQILAHEKVDNPTTPALSGIASLPGCEKTPQAIMEAMQKDDQRKILYKYVISNGWSWSDVHGNNPSIHATS